MSNARHCLLRSREPLSLLKHQGWLDILPLAGGVGTLQMPQEAEGKVEWMEVNTRLINLRGVGG